ncbi:MAG: hypothetical protein RBR38_01140 [Desulfomicrobium apsheronum]|jgi:hypothetical protein|uniref:Uncharacterized protein n=2 Tax=Desulfomicrobium TaxID=898 RepID=A0A8G2F2X3_DESNO|nr:MULTISPECIES: hypothetical protein [Desulfomicrobium]MBE1426997.1 hypothetical protein [Desulfomicrobium macestii]MDY0225414.1 hypothetical protein [Desulfomicrobium apsheronum]SFL26975.1 hypothetical protein SAMN05421830_101260 [Desulfomicrobium norvegicum]
MEEKKGALVPVEKREEPPITPVEQEYEHAKSYFKESTLQAAKVNAALLTVLGVFVVRGIRYAWEALSCRFPWRRKK